MTKVWSFSVKLYYHKNSKEAEMVAAANKFIFSFIGFAAFNTPVTYTGKKIRASKCASPFYLEIKIPNNDIDNSTCSIVWFLPKYTSSICNLWRLNQNERETGYSIF